MSYIGKDTIQGCYGFHIRRKPRFFGQKNVTVAGYYLDLVRDLYLYSRFVSQQFVREF